MAAALLRPGRKLGRLQAAEAEAVRHWRQREAERVACTAERIPEFA